MNTLGQVLDKVLSGRFILTFVVALIILKVCWVNVEYVKEFKEIFLVVIYAYFNRSDRPPQEGTKVTETTKTTELTKETIAPTKTESTEGEKKNEKVNS